ncbi:4a-hydroxytetrahydrobiopterin dehydratase [Flavobacterium sp. 7A]|uniref:4a-hydroxytetrahydrobiopterin dehydratase n=1 Tax=Flavobacterium sp. 7A TaxID=2940571 RepID=UPI002225DC5A|nr:4a-hydroxytetrahydrobiopterin dehydratase [Flavobacterium sp. 7A]MCW2119060.1 4a-hydroxytetrahydrobiopterin dehydratase [Flavobacterium sp. 7A]
MEKYTDINAKPLLEKLKGWEFKSDGIEKKFIFNNFSHALGFIMQIGLLAEKQNHHPELFNVYNKVTIRLSTHEVGGVTDKDFSLATSIEDI